MDFSFLEKASLPSSEDESVGYEEDDEEEIREKTLDDVFRACVRNDQYASNFVHKTTTSDKWVEKTSKNFQKFHKNVSKSLKRVALFDEGGYPDPSAISAMFPVISGMVQDKNFEQSLGWFTDVITLLILSFPAYNVTLIPNADKYLKIMIGKSHGGIGICCIRNSPFLSATQNFLLKTKERSFTKRKTVGTSI
jgi:hypothetical protein